MKVTEYDNRKVIDLAYGEVVQGTVSFYTIKGKVVLNFTDETVACYVRADSPYRDWNRVAYWELNR